MLRTLLIIPLLLFSSSNISWAEDDLTFLKNDTPYTEVHILLLKNGWKPFSFGITNSEKVFPSCLKRMSSVDCFSNKSEYCEEVIENYKLFPEFETCSSEGYCMMIMENKNKQQLVISVYGDGYKELPDMNVTGWRFDKWDD